MSAAWLAGAAPLVDPMDVAAAGGPAVPVAAARPVPVPIEEVTAGLPATGWTVSQGTRPETFQVTVLGVVPDGIGPGVDLIVFEAASPALDAAGGIWAGMSGSPVYTRDGRLLGAVSYGFSAAPSKIGGLTPAASMLALLDDPAAVPAAPAARVKLPNAMARELMDSRRATATQAAVGLAPLPLPLSVSGLTTRRLDDLNARFERAGSAMRAYDGAAACGAPAPSGALFAGSNFAAAISYGDVTQAAIGTTTLVYRNTAVAFGHPMLFHGPTGMSAHEANALGMGKDPVLGSFKLAAVGGVAGTVDHDRLVGLASALGPGPAGAVPITSTVRYGDTERTATTWITLGSCAADTTAIHLAGNLDRVFDRVGPGRVEVSWVVRGTSGTRGDGAAWQLAHTNLYPSAYDASGDATAELLNQLSAVVDNPFEPVKITNITLTAVVRADYGMDTVDALQIERDGEWVDVDVTGGVSLTPGQPLDLRVRLSQEHDSTQVVDVRLDGPQGTSTGGVLTVYGTYTERPSTPIVSSFPALVDALASMTPNNHLVVWLSVTQADGHRHVTQRTIALDDAVTGFLTVPVE